MPIPVELQHIASDLEMQSDDHVCYISARTGEVIRVGGFSEDADSLADLLEDELPEGMEVGEYLEESPDWHSLPTKFDTYDWGMMRDFALECGGETSQILEDAIHGSGAFRMFRRDIERLGLLDRWYQYRNDRYLEIARQALDDLGIPYK